MAVKKKKKGGRELLISILATVLYWQSRKYNKRGGGGKSEMAFVIAQSHHKDSYSDPMYSSSFFSIDGCCSRKWISAEAEFSN